MTLHRCIAALGQLFVASAVVAQVPETERFRPLAFLVGSCWTGTFPDGKSTDEHCFEWVYDGKFIRDRHKTAGPRAPYEGETWYGWDAEKGSLVYWYFNSLGGVSTGTAQATAEGIMFPERHVSGQEVREFRNVWRRTGPDTYRTILTERKGEEWVELWTMEFRRPSGPVAR
jgi:hypothetical protein